MVGAEIELVGLEQRESRLRAALSAAALDGWVIIDCPPSLGLLTINALVAADTVLVPLQCEFYALEGLTHLLKTVKLIREKLNPGLRVGGIVLKGVGIEVFWRDLVALVVFAAVITTLASLRLKREWA